MDSGPIGNRTDAPNVSRTVDDGEHQCRKGAREDDVVQNMLQDVMCHGHDEARPRPPSVTTTPTIIPPTGRYHRSHLHHARLTVLAPW